MFYTTMEGLMKTKHGNKINNMVPLDRSQLALLRGGSTSLGTDRNDFGVTVGGPIVKSGGN